MSIVLPIVFGAFVLGVLVRRMTRREWTWFALYIMAVLAYYWVTHD